MIYEVLKLNVENSTPLLIGGYDTQAYSEFHEEELRTQSIKGLWRWWFRAILSGRHLLQGYTDIETKVKDEVGMVLGFAGRRGSQSSRLALRFTRDKPPIYRQIKPKQSGTPPRVSLLTLGGNILNYIESIRGSLSVYLFSFQEERRTVKDENVRIAILSLVSGLLLSGIGKGSRRGLGCIDFKIVEDRVGLPESLKRWIFPDALRDILKEALPVKKHVEIKNYPLIPSVAPDFFKLWYIPFEGKEVGRVLTDLQEFTLRTKRRMVIPENGEDPFRLKLIAWILGLPRQVKGTGYISGEIQRRASPLIFSVHRDFATVCLFKSSDWPDNIEWRGRDRKLNIINIKEKLDSAYKSLESIFLGYMRKKGYNVQEVRIW